MAMNERMAPSPMQGSPPATTMDWVRGLVWIVAQPLEILSHTQFGVRYLSQLSIFTVLFLMIVAKAVMGLILMVVAMFSRSPAVVILHLPLGGKSTFDLYLFDIFTWVVFVVGACHQISIRRRIMRDEIGYTYDSGRPYMFVWGLVSHDEWVIKRYWEPGAWWFASCALQSVDQVLSWYLFISSFALTGQGQFDLLPHAGESNGTCMTRQ